MVSHLFFMLASSGGSAWAHSLFRSIRSQAISSSGMFSALATGVACIIIVFKLVRLSYEIMSDEQQAGFGGVRLWTILRPVVILLLLQSCPLWIGGLDSIANGVAMAVQSSVDVAMDSKSTVQCFEISEQQMDKVSENEMERIMAEESEKYNEAIKQAEENFNRMGGSASGSYFSYLIEKIGIKNDYKRSVREDTMQLMESKGMDTRNGSGIRAAINDYFKTARRYTTADGTGYQINIHDKNLIPAICNWLYDKLYLVIQAFAEILLTVLALCAPWMLVASLVEPWKNNFWNFVAQYVQISFWKVIAAGINFATVTFRCTTVKAILDGKVAAINAIASGGTAATGAEAGIALSAIISIAGVFALLKVSDIAAAIIPSTGGNIGSSAGGAGTALAPVQTGMKAAGGAVKTGVRLFTGGRR